VICWFSLGTSVGLFGIVTNLPVAYKERDFSTRSESIGCWRKLTETWSPKLNKEHRLALSENSFFKMIFGAKTEEMIIN
jgi:hypothetical protein